MREAKVPRLSVKEARRARTWRVPAHGLIEHHSALMKYQYINLLVAADERLSPRPSDVPNAETKPALVVVARGHGVGCITRGASPARLTVFAGNTAENTLSGYATGGSWNV